MINTVNRNPDKILTIFAIFVVCMLLLLFIFYIFIVIWYKPLKVTSNGSLVTGALIISLKSISFSSLKCSSRPPPEAKRNGMKSGAWNPYSG